MCQQYSQVEKYSGWKNVSIPPSCTLRTKFHYCRILITSFREGGVLPTPHPPSVSSPKNAHTKQGLRVTFLHITLVSADASSHKLAQIFMRYSSEYLPNTFLNTFLVSKLESCLSQKMTFSQFFHFGRQLQNLLSYNLQFLH